ncbi:hypothetical protein M441DRAFT_375282 [Trichoderma asperellum CBS 433.97]|uniref:Transmembrane protein n=1 Tax=Trichoderma asperellum (strain ATCC 204424 / CBS 433.97 / NBRC 101777) TaxID=1042311 RepID=A0A2T3ZFJ5_TRIA4|nr:hypothetical protein M441DRAFT_375282 [Trichoderma asperellum CBS 433.97]PTB43574.1 hypothetical protein M441DRAFT_375282 [Trichoderma asperellum CBS 433.97]
MTPRGKREKKKKKAVHKTEYERENMGYGGRENFCGFFSNSLRRGVARGAIFKLYGSCFYVSVESWLPVWDLDQVQFGAKKDNKDAKRMNHARLLDLVFLLLLLTCFLWWAVKEGRVGKTDLLRCGERTDLMGRSR